MTEEHEPYFSDNDVERDFEEPKPCPSFMQQSQLPPPINLASPAANSYIYSNVQTDSMATIRLNRRARLAEKLRDVFELEGIDQVLAGGHLL